MVCASRGKESGSHPETGLEIKHEPLDSGIRGGGLLEEGQHLVNQQIRLVLEHHDLLILGNQRDVAQLVLQRLLNHHVIPEADTKNTAWQQAAQGVRQAGRAGSTGR